MKIIDQKTKKPTFYTPTLVLNGVGIAKEITKKLVDVFLDINLTPTGFEETNWLRLQKRGNQWIQLSGIKIPSYKFKMITEALK